MTTSLVVGFALIFLAADVYCYFRKVEKRGDPKPNFAFEGILACRFGREEKDFQNYGCYCGASKKIKTSFSQKVDPVDNLDRCCKKYRECLWATFTGDNRCSHTAIINCDSEASKCLDKDAVKYNSAYANYDNCLNKGEMLS